MTTKPAKGAKPKEAWTTEFEDWTLDTIANAQDWLGRLIRNGVAEAIGIMAASNVRCYFKLESDDTSDPTDMSIDIMDPEAMVEDVAWTFSLSDVVARFIDIVSAGDGCIHGDDVDRAEQLRDALRALADQIDARIAKTPEAQ